MPRREGASAAASAGGGADETGGGGYEDQLLGSPRIPFFLPAGKLATLCRDIYRWEFRASEDQKVVHQHPDVDDSVTAFTLFSCARTDAQCAVAPGGALRDDAPGGTGEGLGAVVVFRGTESLRDARVDLDARRVCLDAARCDGLSEVPRERQTWRCRLGWCACPKVHAGFWRQYVSLRDPVLESLQRRHTPLPSEDCGADEDQITPPSSSGSWIDRRQHPEVWFTGHSLGGALSLIAATDFALREMTPGGRAKRVVGCATFGAPRCGDAQFAALARGALPSDKYARVVHVGDAVPTLPLAWRFAHVRAPIRVPCPAPPPPALPVRWFRFARDFALASLSSADSAGHPHSVKGYVAALLGQEARRATG